MRMRPLTTSTEPASTGKYGRFKSMAERKRLFELLRQRMIAKRERSLQIQEQNRE